LFLATFQIDLTSHNAFQNDLDLGPFAFTLRAAIGDVASPAPVPEPSSWGTGGALALLSLVLLAPSSKDGLNTSMTPGAVEAVIEILLRSHELLPQKSAHDAKKQLT